MNDSNTNIDALNKKLTKDISVVIKDNKRLQTELISKNSTITELVNKNFIELQSINQIHIDIVNKIHNLYHESLEKINREINLTKKSYNKHLRNTIKNYNVTYSSQISILKKEISQLLEKNTTINAEYDKYCISNHRLGEENQSLKNTLIDLNKIKDEYDTILPIYNNQITTINIMKNDYNRLCMELNESSLKINDSKDLLKKNSQEFEIQKKSFDELTLVHHKTMLEINDYQRQLGENVLTINNLHKSINNLESELLVTDSAKTKMNLDINEYCDKISHLQKSFVDTKQMLDEIKLDNNNNSNEKLYYMSEYNKLKILHDESEKINSETILQMSDKISNKYENIIESLKSDLNIKLSERENQISGLTSHLKIQVDGQHLVLAELEMLRAQNDKLRNNNITLSGQTTQYVIPTNKITNTNYTTKKEIEDLKLQCQQEKDTAKKIQESNDILQQRLNQTMDALASSKNTVTSLKETNLELEHKINSNHSLNEKINKLTEINLELSSQIEIYDSKLSHLQNKYNQLINIAKKKINIAI